MIESGTQRDLDKRHTFIHTNGMKIAISIPDSVFRDVKKAAEEQKRSRSEIFVEAVREYLAKLESRRIFDSLNEAYGAPETEEERDAREAALDLYKRTVLKREDW
jgi:metal-responsive CopG/Arc/MetJ family transcriptional regulator